MQSTHIGLLLFGSELHIILVCAYNYNMCSCSIYMEKIENIEKKSYIFDIFKNITIFSNPGMEALACARKLTTSTSASMISMVIKEQERKRTIISDVVTNLNTDSRLTTSLALVALAALRSSSRNAVHVSRRPASSTLGRKSCRTSSTWYLSSLIPGRPPAVTACVARSSPVTLRRPR